ncbi:MAG TPA: hypothetical protein PKM25_04750 [Candidatus Ozemobacteraceae bacterium]|nr:hypothetical protein [Candidatus Ozemobacteraceae bacterium]
MTFLICGVIGWGYNHLTTRIQLKQSGITVAARIIDRETTANSTYVKFTYTAGGKTWTKSMRLPDPKAFAGTDTILLKVAPGSPGDPYLHFHDTDLSRELQYTMLAALVWLLWRGTKLMIASTRPNWH